MTGLLIPFAIALATSLALVPICRAASRRFGKVAQPRADRWHRGTVALFGGVAIGLTLFACAGAYGLHHDVPVLLCCGAVMFATGLVDDLITLKPSTKLIAQMGVAAALLFFGYRLNWLHSITLDSLLTIIWVVGVTNAFNLLDNMDGLCAGIALIVGGALLVDVVSRGPAGGTLPEARYLALLGGATLGFLVYNFNPASIFMGDSGSLLLGFSFAAMTLSATHEAAARSNLLSIVAAPVFVLLIPIFDTTLVTVLRKLSGRAASSGGRDHSSHRLVAIGLSERAAVMVLWLLAGIGGILSIAMRHVSQSWMGLASVVFLLVMVLIAVYLARIRVYDGDDARVLREGTVTPIVVEFMYKRRVAEVLLDFCLIAIAYYAAYRFRFEREDFLANFGAFKNSLPVVLSVQLAAFFVVGVYRGVWRYFGLSDTVVVAKGVFAGTVVSQIIVLYSPRFIGYSRTVFAIYALLLVGFVTLSRVSFRLIGEFVQRRRHGASRAVIYGAGDAGAMAVRELLSRRDEPIRIVGFVDDDPRKAGARVQGYRVVGDSRVLMDLVSAGAIDSVVISSRAISDERIAWVAAQCPPESIKIWRLHIGFEQVGGGSPVNRAAAESGSALPKPLPFSRKGGRGPR